MNRRADLGVSSHWIYKDNIDVKDGKQFRWIRQILDILDFSKEPEDFLELTKIQMYQDQVFVFTPKGDLVSLPKGAMPLDFAFSVHTDIGLNCMGVKINNSIKVMFAVGLGFFIIFVLIAAFVYLSQSFLGQIIPFFSLFMSVFIIYFGIV